MIKTQIGVPRLYLTTAAIASQALALLLACSAVAQDTAAGEAKEMKPTVVTGTYLESADAAGTLTVTPVELTEPINQGYSTVEDVLRTKLPQYGGPGNLNPSFGNGGDGNSYIALRGLPGSATLVLVNGRRVAIGALNLIPDAAVEKIEILNDGGSAVYGSDAVAGVVNIILKKNFQGTKLTATYGFTPEVPRWEEKKFQILAGDTTDKGNFVISAEYSDSTQLLSPDRYPASLATGTSGTGNPGTIFNNTSYGSTTNSLGNVIPNRIGLPWHVNPAVTTGLTSSNQIPAGFNPLASVDTSAATTSTEARAIRDQAIADLNAALGPNSPVLYGNGPRFNYPAYTTLYRPHWKYDFSGSGEYKLINDTVKIFAEAYYVNYRSQSQLAPSPLTGLTIPLNNYWFQQVFPGTYTGDLSQNYRVVEMGPRVYTDEFDEFRFVGGLRGDIADTTWKWEVGYLFTQNRQTEEAAGGVVLSTLDALLAMNTPGAWNPFGYTPPFGQTTVNPTQVGTLADKGYIQWLNKIQGIDFNTSGEVIDLPGGPLKLALGFNYRRESFDQIPDLATKTGLIWPFNTYPAYGAMREIWGGYGEVLVPVFGKDFNIPAFSELSLSAALRYEDYSDVGDTDILPRVSGRWKPLEKENFSIRGSYAEGFSAPGFGDLYSPPGQNYTEIYNPYTRTYEQPTDAVLDTGNPNLKPTTGKTWLVGADYAPSFVKSLTVGLDYYRIEQEGIPFQSPDYIVAQWVAAGGNGNPNNPWGPTAAPSAVNPAGSQVSYNEVTGQFEQIRNNAPINAGKRNTDGLDFNVAHAFETGLGTFTVSGLATYVLTFEQQDVAGSPYIDYLGRFWPSGAALAETGYPNWRANLTLAYNWKRFNAAIGANYTDGYKENVDLGNGPVDRDVEYYLTFDVRLGVRIPVIEADFLIGVNNLFDEAPSTVYNSFENNFDRAIGDPRGRMVFVSLSKQF